MNKIVTYIFILVAPYFSLSQNYWEIIEVPDTIKITCMATNNQNHIFLGTVGTIGGIYQSVDNCNSWEFLGFENSGIEFIESNSINHLFTSFTNCIYKSTNNGINWDTIYYNNETINIKCLKSFNEDLIFAGLSLNISGIIRSLNGGVDWEEVFVLPSNAEFIYDIAILNNDTIYVGTTDWFDGGGVYRSVDGGDNWEHIGMYDFHVLALEVNSNGELFAGTYGHNTQYWLSGVYIYNELTNEWTALLAYKFINDILINQDDEIFVACDYIGAGVLYSNNNGQSFEYINEGLFEGGVDDLAIDSSGYLYASSYEEANLARSLEPTITILPKYLSKENDIVVQTYPNPFSSVLNFEIHHDEGNLPVEIKLYTILGQQVKNIKTKLSQNGPTLINFDAGNIPAGSYFYSINCNGKVYSDKVLKQ